MSLEFNKVVDQVHKMGDMLDALDFDVGDRLKVAMERFYNPPTLAKIQERVDLVQGPTVSGYRGAIPVKGDAYEDLSLTFAPPPPPPSATIIAADGSQIYPKEQAVIHYYLINIGLFTYHYGIQRTPEFSTVPKLFYHKDYVHDKGGRVISNRTVDARRTVKEMQELGKLAWQMKGEARPLIALYDNHLLFGVNAEVVGHKAIMRAYRGALINLHDAGAILCGYIDNPNRSRMVIRMLYLLSLDDDQVERADLTTGGDLEGLRDTHLFDAVLAPGERSAIMVQNSPRNLDYKQGEGGGPSYEIAFFYVKVVSEYRSVIARIDIPMWVARDKNAVDELHALIIEQCRMQGRNPYPYALTRADELAVVTGRDKAKLDEMIHLELRKKNIEPIIFSAKAWGKELARSPKRRHDMKRIGTPGGS